MIELIAQFPSLTSVDLSRCSLTDAAASALAALPGLVSLTVENNDFSEQGKRVLVDRFGEQVRF